MKNHDLYVSPYNNAKEKGTSQLTYFILSLLLGVYALVLVLCLIL